VAKYFTIFSPPKTGAVNYATFILGSLDCCTSAAVLLLCGHVQYYVCVSAKKGIPFQDLSLSLCLEAVIARHLEIKKEK